MTQQRKRRVWAVMRVLDDGTERFCGAYRKPLPEDAVLQYVQEEVFRFDVQHEKLHVQFDGARTKDDQSVKVVVIRRFGKMIERVGIFRVNRFEYEEK